MSGQDRRWNHNIHYYPLVLAAIPPGCQRVLEVGCGEGMLARQLAHRVPHVVGIDHDAASIELVRHALFHTPAHGGQFVLLSDPAHHNGINGHFGHLKHYLNDNPDCHLELGYREELAHLVYAGADLLVVPSMFEPCGLAPMTAMKYGTTPLVRAVGGMADTVFDRDNSARPPHERNGHVFHQADNLAIDSALSRALGLWFAYPAAFRELMANAMRTDYSWAKPGQHYLNIYEYIRHK